MEVTNKSKVKTIVRKIVILIILVCSSSLISCSDNNQIAIDYSEKVNELEVGEFFSLSKILSGTNVYYETTNTNVIVVEGYYCKAIAEGEAILIAKDIFGNTIKKYLVRVIGDDLNDLEIIGLERLEVGESTTYALSKNIDSENLMWESNNPNIAVVENGKVTGISSGIVTIKVSLINNSNTYATKQILVTNSTYNGYLNNQYQDFTEVVDLSSIEGILEPIIKKSKTFTIGVNVYTKNFSEVRLSSTGTAVIYKRNAVSVDGSISSDITDDTIYYQYYAITAKSVVNDASFITIYYNNSEINAEVIAVDSKVDIGVIRFTSKDYFSVATFGDSDALKTGEFVVALGNSYGSEYPNSASFGIVSYDSRYVATDTDNDSVNDWDALYIQHDAAVGEGSSGGALVNMKGEVIGINSLMISDEKIDNMAFAIPINLVMELVELLEQGIVPTRPLLLISVVSVKDILKNDYLLEYYPLPEGVKSGFYVAEVTEGGVGSAAGMHVGDIIIEFDGQKISYTYELRMMLNEVIIGSNEEHLIVVNRNGTLITLKVVF